MRAEVVRAEAVRAEGVRAEVVRPESVVPEPRGMRRGHPGLDQAFGDVSEEVGQFEALAEPANERSAGNARGPGSRRFWPTSGARAPEAARTGLEPTGVDLRFRDAAGPDANQVGSVADRMGINSVPLAGEQAADLGASGGNRIGRQGRGPARDHAGATPVDAADVGSAADAQLIPDGREGEARGGLAPEVDGKTPAGDEDRGDSRPARGHGARRGRSFFRRFAVIEKIDEPASGRLELAVPAAGPTEVRLVPLDSLGTVDGADDLRAAADRRGDPELDIDLDLDRVADADFDESSRDLHGLGVVDADMAGYDRYGLGAASLGLGDDDDDWLADKDARTAPAEDPDDPEISGDFAVVDTAASGTFPDPFDDFDETASGWRQWAGRSDTYGDRVEGWIRPQYRDEPEPVPGEYWTPVPESSYASGYGWPVPVARLPEVPPYPPASGFDMPAETESEPTAVVPQWPPVRPNDRIELPRSWSRHDETTRGEEPTPDKPQIDEYAPSKATPVAAGVRGDMAALGDEDERRDRAAFEDSERQIAVDFDGVERRLGLASDGLELPVAGAFDGSGRRGDGEYSAETGHGNEERRQEETGARDAGRFHVEAGGPDQAATSDAGRFRDPIVRLRGAAARIGESPHIDDARADAYTANTGNDEGAGGTFGGANARDGRTWDGGARDRSAHDGSPWDGGVRDDSIRDGARDGSGHQGVSQDEGVWDGDARDSSGGDGAGRDRDDRGGNRWDDGGWDGARDIAARDLSARGRGVRVGDGRDGDDRDEEVRRNLAGNESGAGVSGTSPVPGGWGPSSRGSSPVRGSAKGYAARADSLDGPIWTVPDLPEAVLPDLSWAPEESADDDAPRRFRRPAGVVRRRRPAAQGEDPTQALPSLDSTDQPRVRPRPRPRPGNVQPDPRSTVYVSRHAAEPG